MGSMHLYFPKGRMPAWRPPFMRLFLVYILHHVLHTALQQPAELVDGVGRYDAAVFHGVKVRQRQAAPETPRPGWPQGSPEQNSCCPKRKASHL